MYDQTSVVGCEIHSPCHNVIAYIEACWTLESSASPWTFDRLSLDVW
jgi:hypothetical protein